jgi:hypothetical protein
MSSSVNKSHRQSKFAGRKAFKSLSQILNWQDVKNFMKTKKVPNMLDFVNEEAKAYSKEFKQGGEETINICDIRDFSLGDQLEFMPRYSDLEGMIRHKKLSQIMHKILLGYWRLQLCQDKGKLMSAWMYELHRPKDGEPFYRCSERMVQDRNIVLHNSDFPYFIILLWVDGNLHLVEYMKDKHCIKYIRFLEDGSEEAKEEHRAFREEQAKQVFNHFDNLNNRLFDDMIVVADRDYKEEITRINIDYCVHRYMMDKYLNCSDLILDHVENMAVWVIRKMNIWSLNLLSPRKQKDSGSSPAPKEIKIVQSSLKGPIKAVKVPTEVDDPHKTKKNLSKTEKKIELEDQADNDNEITRDMKKSKPKKIIMTPQNQSTRNLQSGKPSRDVSPFEAEEPMDQEALEHKYQDVRRLLWFYYYHDKQRYKLFVKKCLEIKDQQVINFLGVEKLERPHQNVGHLLSGLGAGNPHPKPDPGHVFMSGGLPALPYKTPQLVIGRKSMQVKNGVHFEDVNDDGQHATTSPRQRVKSDSRNCPLPPLISLGNSPERKQNPILPRSLNQSLRASIGREPLASITPSTSRRDSILSRPMSREVKKSKRFFNDGSHSPLSPTLPPISKRNSSNEFGESPETSNPSPKDFKIQDAKTMDKAIAYINSTAPSSNGDSTSEYTILPSSFYTTLVEDPSSDQPTIKYKKVESMLEPLCHKGKSLIDSHDHIGIPICEDIGGVTLFHAIVIDTKSKDIWLYSPTNKNAASSIKLKNNKYIKAIIDFIKKEVRNRSGVTVDTKKYSLKEVVSGLDPSSSTEVGLYTASFLEAKCKGNKEKELPLQFVQDLQKRLAKSIK